MGRPTMRHVLALATLIAVLSTSTTALAADGSSFPAPLVVFGDDPPVETSMDASVWHLDFGAATVTPLEVAVARPMSLVAHARVMQDQPAVRRPVAYTYSEGYEIRAKVHRFASYLTLPLFAGQFYLGRELDHGSESDAVRATHAGIATTMVGLFTVNTVTGVWNLIEGRSNPNGRTRRLLHGLTMLAADAGFVATGLLAPTNDGRGNQSLHKTVAITSIGAATASYLLMLFGQ